MQGVASVLESHCCDGDDLIAALLEAHFRGNLKQIPSPLSISSENVETHLSVGFNEVSTSTKHKHGNADCPKTRSSDRSITMFCCPTVDVVRRDVS